ncbi:venom protease [Anabrus simplex]|uniref:venom protease n=1 Tax=Anabrus simplex TaxID=316456 RepID=UPI0034DD3437
MCGLAPRVLVVVMATAFVVLCQQGSRAAAPPPNLPTPTVQTHHNDTEPLRKRCNCVCGVPNRKQRIVGGQVTKVNEFPWVVALSRRGKFYCGGTVITRKHILTAAHCIEGIELSDIQVTLGEHDRSIRNESESTERRIKNGTRHDGFTLLTFNNDIAVLELDKPVDFGSSIKPACLPQSNAVNYTNSVGIVTGWGRIEERKPTSNMLRKVAVPIISMDRCRRAGYPRHRITENMICAGYPQGKQDACQGDSGGPMHIDTEKGGLEVIGIVSWGRGCARPNFPGIYTRIANYLDWVEDRVGDECLCSPQH